MPSTKTKRKMTDKEQMTSALNEISRKQEKELAAVRAKAEASAKKKGTVTPAKKGPVVPAEEPVNPLDAEAVLQDRLKKAGVK